MLQQKLIPGATSARNLCTITGPNHVPSVQSPISKHSGGRQKPRMHLRHHQEHGREQAKDTVHPRACLIPGALPFPSSRTPSFASGDLSSNDGGRGRCPGLGSSETSPGAVRRDAARRVPLKSKQKKKRSKKKSQGRGIRSEQVVTGRGTGSDVDVDPHGHTMLWHYWKIQTTVTQKIEQIREKQRREKARDRQGQEGLG